MKNKFAVMASCLAGVIATTMPVNADEINTAISGSTHSLGFGPDLRGASEPVLLGSISHTVNIALKKNGKKSKNPHDRRTAVTNSRTFPISGCFNDEGPGVLLQYEYSYSVGTRKNGDLIFVELDPDRISTTCINPVSPFYYEATVYREITGGTGEYEGACGWIEFNGTGNFFNGDVSSFATIDGRQVGEIFLSSDCP